MYLELVVILWIINWLIYLANNIFSGYMIAPEYGDYIAHLYRNITIVPVYLLISRHYINKMNELFIHTRAIQTGLIWMALSLTADFFLWFVVLDFSFEYLLHQFFIWDGRLYALELIALFISPYLLHVYFKKYPNDPIYKFFKDLF